MSDRRKLADRLGAEIVHVYKGGDLRGPLDEEARVDPQAVRAMFEWAWQHGYACCELGDHDYNEQAWQEWLEEGE